jgi:1,4-alpha-glucan branching enzyme
MTPKKVSVTVRYSKPGISPPVFLAGTFSDWQLEEMQYSSVADNEYEFHKEVQIEEGREYQYKFRIGEGDWWVLNEDSPSGTSSFSITRTSDRQSITDNIFLSCQPVFIDL